MEPISVALGLAQFFPAIAKWVTGSDKAAEVAEKVVKVAKVVTGKDTGEEALEAIKADPAVALQFQQAMFKHEVDLNTLAVSNASDINQTMRVEAGSERWPQYWWRPAIGFAVAIAVILSVLAVFMAYIALFYGRAEGVAALPGILGAIAGIIAVVSPILGIASWFRGKMQADPNIPNPNR